MSPDLVVPHRVLFGRDRRATGAALAVGAALFVASSLFWRVPGVSETAYDVLPVDVIGGGVALLVLAVAAHAYVNQGLVVGWLLAFLPMLGATLNFVGVGTTAATPAERFVLAVVVALGAALLVGTAGYLLGRALGSVRRVAGLAAAA